MIDFFFVFIYIRICGSKNGLDFFFGILWLDFLKFKFIMLENILENGD